MAYDETIHGWGYEVSKSQIKALICGLDAVDLSNGRFLA